MENNKVDIINKLRKERLELTGKIKKLEEFRRTETWNELTLSHKQLLDIQLSIMKSYLEVLVSRCVDLLSSSDVPKNSKESNKLFVIDVKVIDDND